MIEKAKCDLVVLWAIVSSIMHRRSPKQTKPVNILLHCVMGGPILWFLLWFNVTLTKLFGDKDGCSKR